ncbi:MAG: hypothetical protein Q4F97_06210 [Bacteroidales bacterium]|nr:hypothetical protein [Bacteroidales bacterium]
MKNQREIWQSLVDECAKKISVQPSKKWDNRFYIDLSRNIFKQTKVLISPSTLKRIFGKVKVEDFYNPHNDTKDAVAKFIGYESWNGYCEKFILDYSNNKAVEQKRSSYLSKGIKITAFLMLSVILILVVVNNLFHNIKAEKNLDSYEKDVTLIDEIRVAPYTATFHVKNKSDVPLYIVFNNDSILMRKGEYDYCFYFKLPGTEIIKVVRGNILVEKIPVIIESNGWRGYCHNTFEVEYYIKPSSNSRLIYTNKRECARFDQNDITSFGMSDKDYYLTEYRYIKSGLIKDSVFNVEFKILNDFHVPAIYCDHVVVRLYFTKDIVELHFTKNGCEFYTAINLPGEKNSGQSNNINYMGLDLSKYNDINVRINKNNFILYINKTKVYNTSLTESFGECHGISFLFTGLGTFKDVSFETQTDKISI